MVLPGTLKLWLILSLLLFHKPINSSNTKTSYFDGTVVRVGGYSIRPGLVLKHSANGNLTYHGYSKEILDILFSSLGMKYQFVEIDEEEIASKGMLFSMLDQLRRNEADLNAYGFIPTIERIKHFDFTIPVMYDQYRFLVNYPKQQSRLLGLVRPFQMPVWILFFFAIAVVNFSLSWMMFYFRKRRSARRRRRFPTFMELIGDNAVYTCTVIIGQAEYVLEPKLPVRIVLAVWCLVALILINCYTGNLVSYLTVPKLDPIVSSFKDVAYKSKTGLAIESKSVLAENILNATSGPYKIIGDEIRANPNLLLKSVVEMGITIRTYKVPYLGINYAVQYAIGVHAKDDCRYTQSKLLPLFRSFSFVLHKHSPFTDPLNSRLQHMIENGVMEQLRTNYLPSIDRCLISKIKRPNTTALKLIDFIGAFAILGVGVGMTVLTLLIEIILSRLTRC